MRYVEYPVPASLRRQLECVWRLHQPDATGDPQTIYPDGRCELIVHRATPMSMFELNRGWHRQRRTLFAAQLTSAIRLAADGPVDCIGIRLRPAASGCIVRRPLAELNDRVVDLAGMDAPFARRLKSAVGAFAGGAKPAALWRLLSDRLAAHPVDRRIEAAVARLEADQGRTRIGDLAAATGMSPRGFQMRFRQTVGIAPKRFARIVRLQAALRELDAGADSLAILAAEAGYSDQAHATRELGRLTGLTPARLRSALCQDRQCEQTIRLAAAFVRGHG